MVRINTMSGTILLVKLETMFFSIVQIFKNCGVASEWVVINRSKK